MYFEEIGIIGVMVLTVIGFIFLFYIEVSNTKHISSAQDCETFCRWSSVETYTKNHCICVDLDEKAH
jgi:hypothetical protein